MSIGIALKGKDGIILATDSRRTFLDGRYEDNFAKAFVLSPKVGVIQLGGHAGYGYWLIERYRLKRQFKSDIKEEAFEDVVDSFLHSVKDDFDYITSRSSRQALLDPNYQLLFIIAGYNSVGEACIVNLVSNEFAYPFAPDLNSGGICVGGIDLIWHYWENQLKARNLRVEEMSIKSLKVLGAFIINETAKASNLVGGIPHIFAIEKGKNIEKIEREEIEKLKKEVESIVDVERIIEVL